MDREVILTEEGYAKLTEEIEYLTTTKRREVAERIKEAREFGDISENSEYDDAKNEQAQLFYRIQRWSRSSATRRWSTPSTSPPTPSRSAPRDAQGRQEQGDARVLDRGLGRGRPEEPRLSNESPVGKALLGKKKGEKVDDPGSARGAPVTRSSTSGPVSTTADAAAGGGLPALIAERRAKRGRCARRVLTRSRPLRGRGEIAAVRAPHEGLEAGGDRGRAGARGRPAGRAPRPGQGRLPRPRRPQRAHPAAGERRPPGRGGDGGAPRPRPRGHRRRRGPGRRAPAAASCRCAVDGCELLAKALRPPPDKYHGAERPRDALPPPLPRPDGRRGGARAFITRSTVVAGVRRFLDDARLHRGRDADAAAALRRRRGAAVRDAPQRPRPRPLPADRHRALPQAADRRRARAGLRDRQGLPQRGRLATSTTPSSRCSRSTRPTRTTATSWRRSSSWSRPSREAPAARRVALEGGDRLRAALARASTLRDAIREASGHRLRASTPTPTRCARPCARPA